MRSSWEILAKLLGTSGNVARRVTVCVERYTWDSENSAELPTTRPTNRYVKQKEGEKELEYHVLRDDA